MRFFVVVVFFQKVPTTICLQTAKSLARLYLCACSPKPWLVAYVIGTLFSCAGSYSDRITSKPVFQGKQKWVCKTLRPPTICLSIPNAKVRQGHNLDKINPIRFFQTFFYARTHNPNKLIKVQGPS